MSTTNTNMPPQRTVKAINEALDGIRSGMQRLLQKTSKLAHGGESEALGTQTGLSHKQNYEDIFNDLQSLNAQFSVIGYANDEWLEGVGQQTGQKSRSATAGDQQQQPQTGRKGL